MRAEIFRASPSNEFGRMLTRVLIARDIDNLDLHRRLGENGRPVSKQFVNMLVAGKREPTVTMLNRVTSVLDLPDDWIERLHRAAAVDRGYRIGAIE